MTDLLSALVGAPSWAASERLVTDHPWLLSEEAGRVMAARIAAARAAGNEGVVRAYEAHRAFLADAHRDGPAAAFRRRVLDAIPATLHTPWLAAARSSETYLLDRGDGDLTRAIGDLGLLLAHPAFDEAPADRRALMIHARGTALIDRYHAGGDPDDLDRAIGAFATAVAITAEDDPDHPDYLAARGNALAQRHDRTGDLQDLRDSIAALHAVLRIVEPDDEQLPRHLGELAASYGALHDITGEPAHLTTAIETARQAVDATDRSPDGADCAALLNNLVNCLVLSYERSGDLADLRSAVGHAQRAADLGAGEDYFPDLLTTLGSTLLLQYERDGSPGTLDRAVDALDQAAPLLASGDPDRVITLGALATARISRFERGGATGDLDAATTELAEALGGIDPDTPRAALLRTTLGQVLLHRHARLGDAWDLTEALDCFAAAVEPAGQAPRILPVVLAGLGAGHRRAYMGAGDVGHLADGVTAYRDACAHAQSAQPEIALNAGTEWGRWASARQDWPEAAHAYEQAMGAAEQLFRTQFDRTDKEVWLGAAGGLATATAEAHGRAGRPGDAVLALERGRGQLLSEALRGELAVRRPDLAERFRERNEQWRRLRWEPPLWTWSEDIDDTDREST
ncbi:hypothetical protein [Actinoplanes awajinensis]|uniref:Tetratricopeptide repeat protein n=1 Tax=Actinoplanes awajinensis subsp. mycoplanecinus TaxID=135947 RepID=A0A101J7H0_9ACTN|nr:hypothetical protein [Actinoplanes awajinensis]KUL21588.1 hypothetical protein ADL15_50360 [Actinoplanes awajinensis subsp. mycoplanecinus]